MAGRLTWRSGNLGNSSGMREALVMPNRLVFSKQSCTDYMCYTKERPQSRVTRGEELSPQATQVIPDRENPAQNKARGEHSTYSHRLADFSWLHSHSSKDKSQTKPQVAVLTCAWPLWLPGWLRPGGSLHQACLQWLLIIGYYLWPCRDSRSAFVCFHSFSA